MQSAPLRVTLTLPLPPATPTEAPGGVKPNKQPCPACVTIKDWPATCGRADLDALFGFARMLYVRAPLREPPPPVIIIQFTGLDALQLPQLEDAATAMLFPFEAAVLKVAPAGEMPKA